jgi:protein O-GlcNAc transferase
MNLPPDMQRTLEEALALHRSGKLLDAERMYRQVLGRFPQEVNALGLLGVLLHQTGKHEEAIAMLRQAIEVQATADHFVNLSQAYRAAGRKQESLAACEQAVRMAPQLPEAWNNLGTALSDLGQVAGATSAFEKAVSLQPGYLKALLNLINALMQQERLDEVEVLLRKVAVVAPQRAQTWVDLGQLLARRGRFIEAIEMYQRAITIEPGAAIAHNSLGNSLDLTGRTEEAEESFRRATELDPNYAEPWANLGALRWNQDRFDEAIELCRRAIALAPDLAAPKVTLGASLQQLARHREAAEAFSDALQSRSGNPALSSQVGSALVMLSNYSAELSPAEVYQGHVRWGEQHAPEIAQRPMYRNERNPDRRIRVGYVSPDFRRHSVNYFLEPILANHDHERFEVSLYADEIRSDSITERLRGYADRWRKVNGLSAEDLAKRIMEDEIDILVDLAGHTVHNRLLMFARRPAPVQVTYLGYPATTGITQMDYRLTDSFADPPGMTEGFYTERLVRLDPSFLCYRIPEDLPTPSALPALSEGHITFGCFNTLMKITQPVLRLWARVLAAVPGSRLVKKFNAVSDSAKRMVLEEFAANGIAADRVEMVGRVPTFEEHVRLFERIDIALDPFPYNGTTTTCEALAMGLPVVTLAGASHAGRVGVSLLTNVGLPEMVAQHEDDYLRIARELAEDVERLSVLREGLRTKLRTSVLCNERRFTQGLEGAYRETWRSWCQKRP